ncbi:MAG: alkaline phosphatase D family protein [Saprospiraceae bacterium]|nr:alkaline phosphatase D family protein [Saprospiraceae bacterium]
MNKVKFFFVFLVFQFLIMDSYAQLLKSGPMLGYNTLREVGVWVQLEDQGYVAIKYWPTESPSQMKMSETFYSENYKANTATIALGNLEPGTNYSYTVVVNDKESEAGRVYEFTTQKLWHWREDPPNFNFLAGSCVYINESKYDRPGKPYGKSYSIFSKMAEEDAEFMIWLGDNNYLREVDWNSRSGIYHRYSHSRAVTELQPLLAKMHHYAIWDDHDYGPNDSDRTFGHKDVTREAFEDFWANPNYGVMGMGGITGNFVWNDCEFFMLDNRWDRTFPSSEGSILGEKQLTWLIDALRNSSASIKFICVGGQVVSDLAEYENYAVYGAERKKLLNLIDEYNIRNVVFLTGDRHHSEMSVYRTPDGDEIYDITSSPLTSGAYDHSSEKNTFRLKEDAIIGENNYAVIEVSGKRKNRKLKVIFKDVKGKKIKEYKLIGY